MQEWLCVGVFDLKKYGLKLCGIQHDMDLYYFLLDYISLQVGVDFLLVTMVTKGDTHCRKMKKINKDHND